MYFEFAAVLIFCSLGILFLAGGFITGYFVRPNKPDRTKLAVYECGEPTIGTAWVRYNSRFYTLALVYLLFDVEVAVLFPTVLVLRESVASGTAWASLIALMAFLIVLTLGLAYEWFYGNLDWINDAEERREDAKADLAEAGEVSND